MTNMDTGHFKKKLLEEKSKLENELGGISVQSKENNEVWETRQTVADETTNADPNEVADKIEEYETNNSIKANLETQLMDVDDALDKIEKGTYGICEKSGHQIELDRLEANPSARTCKDHMND